MKGTDGRPSLSRGLRNRIRIPYRMLDKRFTNTSRLMVSSKVWQKTIPTNNCDVLLTFPAKTEDSTLMWLLARLKWRVPEVVVNVRHHSSSGIYGFYMTASYENLLKGADDLAIQKPLKSEYGGGLKEFTFEDQECFAGVEDEKTFLTSQERESIVHYMINNLRAEEGEELGKMKFLEGQPIVPLLVSKNIISQVFPLHNSTDLDTLNKTWVQAFDKTQPLDFVERVGLLEDSICEYFGVKIAMYFAYLGHYTISLVFPTVLGILLWILQGNQCFDDFSFVLFAVVNVVWATLFLEHWKRTSAELAYKWGTLDKKDELLEDPRPLFEGDLVKNPVTDQTCFEYPAWKRNVFRYFVTVPVIFICLLVVFVVMLLIFQLQEWINGLVSTGRIPGFIKFLPKIMLALSIGVLDDIYKKIAYWLNDQENYRLETTYEKSLIIKLVLFQFVNSFLSLFYIAFYLQDMSRLRDQLAAIFITRQIVGNLKEVFMPYFIWKFRLFKVGYKMAGEMSPGSIAREFKEMTEPTKEKVDADSPLLAKKAEKVESPVRATSPVSGSPFSSDTEEPKILWPLDKLKPNVTVSSGYGSSHSDDMTSSTEPATSSEHMTSSSVTSTPMTSSSSDATTSTELRPENGEEKHQGPVLTQAEVESVMKPYTDTWEDYMEMVIQFGYVTLFSSAFPLAALCAFINNIIEIRSDAFKLCFHHQRPFGKRVGNIGIWQDVMETMGIIAVIVNCALIGTSGIVPRVAPDMSSSSTILLIIVIEHVILLLKFILAYAIPDVPEWVATEKAKLEFKRRVALKRLESQGGGSPDVKTKTTLKSDSVVNTMSSQNNNNRDDRSGTAMTDDEIRERQMQNRNLINASHASPNNMERIVSRTTERSSSRRLSETSSEGQRRVLGRRYTDPRNNTIYNHHQHEPKRENSRNTSPMHTYSFDDRYDRVFGHDYQHRDTSPAPSTKSSSRSPIKQLLLDEYIASYNSPVSHDRSQTPSNKYLDSHLRKRNLSPIKVSSNPDTWRSSRSPSPGNNKRSTTPGSRPMSPIAHNTPSPSPSPTSYKVNAPFATGIASPTMMRRRKDIIKQQSPPKDFSKNFASVQKQQQYMSRNVSDCLHMDSRIPVADQHRPATSAPFALSLD